MLVGDIAQHFQISEDTVRRDLDSLAERGALTRTHGGAVAMTALVHRDSPFLQRLNTRTPEKQRIAKAAVKLIGDGETLLINGGSTTRFFAAELTQPNLTIVTNNLSVPGALSVELGAEVYLLGDSFDRDLRSPLVQLHQLGFKLRWIRQLSASAVSPSGKG
jgi:DeoR family transcriptional regulator, fructose operon transcriptional repressor